LLVRETASVVGGGAARGEQLVVGGLRLLAALGVTARRHGVTERVEVGVTGLNGYNQLCLWPARVRSIWWRR
jgi:hypothetical protein